MGPTPQILNLALSKWSILIQLGIEASIFTILLLGWSVTKRKLLKSWVIAWVMNIAALVLVYGAQGDNISSVAVRVYYTFYGQFKILFVCFLILGLYQYHRIEIALSSVVKKVVPFIIVGFFLFVWFTGKNTLIIQVTVYSVVSLTLLISSSDVLYRKRNIGTIILASAFALHGLLFLHHTIVIIPFFLGKSIPSYMSRISFIDGISEFLVGLSCIVAVGIMILKELEESNKQLEHNQALMRALLDVDPLTGLHNRRGLRNYINKMSDSEGSIIFIDVNNFKSINDNWGHSAGDKCLRKIAESLRKVFRSEDGLFRMGGDEFLIVTPSLFEIDAKYKITLVQTLLTTNDRFNIPISFSAGICTFGKGTSIEDALNEADFKMYKNKKNSCQK